MNIFRKLRWKLTLSYTIVTVGAFLVILMITAGILLPRIFIPENVLNPEALFNIVKEDTSPLLSHVLSQSPVDKKLVRYLVEGSNYTITSFDLFRIGSIKFNVETVGSFRYYIIGADGSLLGKSSQVDSPNLSIGQPFDSSFYAGLEAPFNAAMLGTTDVKQLYTVFEPDKRFLLAIPIFDDDGDNEKRVVGVAVVILEAIPTQVDIPGHILGIAGRSLIILLSGAGIMGAIFGNFFANGLSRRFSNLSTTIDAWSMGDFSKLIIDNIGDEISQISQRLNHMASQLEELLRRRQEMAVSEERNRLARELHDSAKQQALAASFQLGTALTLFESDPQNAKEHLVEADALVDSVRIELTNLVYELRPHTIDGQDFSEILNGYVLEWAQRTGIEVNINIEGDDESSLETREALFRITQESLANIARHSSASSAALSLEFKKDKVRMVIEDNGSGFDPSTQHHGLGLSTMRERAEGLGGSFYITSDTNQGTQITVILPIP